VFLECLPRQEFARLTRETRENEFRPFS